MFERFGSFMCSLVFVSGCNLGDAEKMASSEDELVPVSVETTQMPEMQNDRTSADYAVATFAGGCFWCTESDFEKVPGVIDAVSGYIDGHVESPTYPQVSAGKTGHVEAVEVHYDPEKVDFNRLLESYWRQVDPTDSGGQFVDRGYQYRPVIFYHDESQKKLALASYEQMAKSGRYDKAITLEIKPASKFWQAEEYHQDYYKKNPIRYKFYRYNSGRDQYLETVWGEDLKLPAMVESKKGDMKMSKQTYTRPSDEEIKAMLTPLQFKVTQKEGTERPFDNEYNDEKREGIFVDIVSGEPLFSSTDKFDSGTGWPSFTKPLVEEYIVEKKDYRLILPRVEVRSKFADSHLGHVFTDGPAPTGLRYCINSAALKFIPKESLASEGYSEYLALFEG